MNGLKYSKFITFVGVSGTCLLLSLYLLKLFDVVDLSIIEQNDFSSIESIFIKYFLLLINIHYLYKITLNYKNNVRYLFIYFVLVSILGFFINENLAMISSTFLPFLLGIYIAHKSDVKIKDFIINFFVYSIIVSILQMILNYIKLGSCNFGYINVNSYVLAIYSIDLILCYIGIERMVTYARQNKLFSNQERKKRLVYTGKLSIYSNNRSVCKSNQKPLNSLKELSLKQLILFYLLIVFYQLFQLIIVLIIGYINNMFLELLIMLPLFWIGKLMIGGVYHSSVLSYCSLITFSGFYILTKINLPLEISIFSTIFMSSVFVFILHKILEHIEELNLLRSWFTKEEQLKKKMLDCNISQIKQKIVIDKLVNHKSSKEIAYEIGITEKTVNNYYSETKRILKIDKKGYFKD